MRNITRNYQIYQLMEREDELFFLFPPVCRQTGCYSQGQDGKLLTCPECLSARSHTKLQVPSNTNSSVTNSNWPGLPTVWRTNMTLISSYHPFHAILTKNIRDLIPPWNNKFNN